MQDENNPCTSSSLTPCKFAEIEVELDKADLSAAKSSLRYTHKELFEMLNNENI